MTSICQRASINLVLSPELPVATWRHSFESGMGRFFHGGICPRRPHHSYAYAEHDDQYTGAILGYK